MPVAEGILLKLAIMELQQHGDTLQITEAWAKSLLTHLGIVMRNGTKDVKTLPQDFVDIQSELVKRVTDIVKENKMPDDLINWDQTGICMVSSGPWTAVNSWLSMEFSHLLFPSRLEILKAVFLARCFFWFSSIISQIPWKILFIALLMTPPTAVPSLISMIAY